MPALKLSHRLSPAGEAIVKIMRITGLDRRFLTVQIRTGSLVPDSK